MWIRGIYKWNEERGLLDQKPSKGTAVTMLHEEIRELNFAENIEEEIDALCDIIVIATGEIMKRRYRVNDCMREVVKEISSRKGAINPDTGKWMKDPNQPKSTLYKADFSKCHMDYEPEKPEIPELYKKPSKTEDVKSCKTEGGQDVD